MVGSGVLEKYIFLLERSPLYATVAGVRHEKSAEEDSLFLARLTVRI
jgi:hypothetical protein